MAGRRVVMFDLGGVVADSPIVAIRKFSAARGIQDLNLFLGKSSAWDAFMRGKIGPAEFPAEAVSESRSIGFADGVSLGSAGWAAMLGAMAGTGAGLMSRESSSAEADALGGYRPLMIRTLKRLRKSGWTVAALTNNFDTPALPDPKAQAEADAIHEKFVSLFDHFIESRVVGLSKPDPRFYEHALRTIGCRADEVIFLDDIGVNLKSAKSMGILTILVRNTSDSSYIDALRELQRLTGVELIEEDNAAKESTRAKL
eukprot:TRINITY_DN16508_c0_g2_i1.p1 TRINITY_DN16508_c0_g2~~TRINITY_DN16508_c0_g2_i1.p1  ORF type:complete len:257 (-),score=39.92 TRINITY_DN16508_c0_g2_i1:49-819(-)